MPKRSPNGGMNKTRRSDKASVVVSESEKNAISKMFKRIEGSDQRVDECNLCKMKIKICLMKDHLESKCEKRVRGVVEKQLELLTQRREVKRSVDEIIVLDDDDDDDDEETNQVDVKPLESDSKRVKTETVEPQVSVEQTTDKIVDKEQSPRPESDINSEDLFLNNYMDEVDSGSPSKSDFDFYLNNFNNAIQSVLNEETFCCLLNESDYETITRFSTLSNKSKALYVRLFQRKFKWLPAESIKYERISANLEEFLKELTEKMFILDETSLETYEEIIYLLKLPQLKELAKTCRVTGGPMQSVKLRSEFIKLILQHFKSQKSLKFHLKSKELGSVKNSPSKDPSKSQFMNQCKKILGKCFKLEKNTRDVFVRVLLLFSLASSHHNDPNKQESGQQQLLQILMINLGKVKFMNYEIKLNVKIFENRDSLLRYQESLEYEYELLNLVESKEFEQAYDIFNEKIYDFQKLILDPDLNEYDSKLPIYLRVFTCGSIYTKILSIYAYEVLQRLRKYQEANDLFEFLIFRQTNYLLSSRGKWYERMALNYESHLKNPVKSFEMLRSGLGDTFCVRKAARLALYQRLMKMAQTKKYMKIDQLKNELGKACVMHKYDYVEAKTIEIEGTILHSEFIPGRKNVFIQNFEHDDDDDESQPEPSATIDGENEESTNESTIAPSVSSSSTSIKSDILVKNRYGLSVEQVALTHYIKVLNFTNGKHAETFTLRTIFGLLFWDVLFDKNVYNVFVDRFQSAPLDLQTDFFYLNRKESIDAKINLLENSPIEFACELATKVWDEFKGVECSLVNWDLFESLDELCSLIKCFTNLQIANLCKYMCDNFRYCRSGGPDLVVWSTKTNKLKFVEVKGPGDRLSFKQIVWLDFMTRNSIDCEVCYVKGKNSKRLRELD